jgi:hypothetical protein
MADQNQMQKDTLGLTDRGINEEGFNFEDFWRHQLNRIKEIAEDEQATEHGCCDCLATDKTRITPTGGRRTRKGITWSRYRRWPVCSPTPCEARSRCSPYRRLS